VALGGGGLERHEFGDVRVGEGQVGETTAVALPFGPPIEPMLAKLAREIPQGDGLLYEPKWDGFRAIAFRDGKDVYIQSRDLRPLNRYFPELIPALSGALPKACVVDGEIVLTTDHGLDFDALQQRIHPAESRVMMLSQKTPASFFAFDLLASGSTDLRTTPLAKRRDRLDRAVGKPPPLRSVRAALKKPGSKVLVTPQTDDAKTASQWLSDYTSLGLDGVVAKRADLLYLPGERAMIKVKKQRTADCVVGGYRLSKSGDGVGSLLLGLYDDSGTLHYVGHTSSFKADERRRLLKELRPLEGGRSFGGGRTPGGPSRWTGDRDLSWVPLKPVLVCEVSFDRMQGDRFRHAATFLRWRTDKRPEECTFDQVA
jgi:ATP-dependent DNA ligase